MKMTQTTSQVAQAEARTRTIANPVPLGLLALALTTALIGASFARFLVPTVRLGLGTVAAPVLIYGGVIQVLAGMWAFRKDQPLPATLFSVYGGFLIAIGVLFLPLSGQLVLLGTNSLVFNHALGLLFLCWTITSGVLFLGAFRTNMALVLVLACLCLSYLFLTIGQFANANGPLLAIGGWIGIACALLSWYTALGKILQATDSPLQLPLGEREGAPFNRAQRYEPAM